MLEFNKIAIRIEGNLLFEMPDLQLDKGLIALVGRNGTGKTTFLNTILGNHSQYSGSLKFKSKSLSDISRLELSRNIAVVFSKPQIFGNHTVLDVLTLGRLPYQNVFAHLTNDDQNKIDKIIALLDLKSMIDREFNTLSDGEKQMVMIGRALVQDTKVILLDEPGAFLDIVNRYKLMQVLKKVGEETDKLILFSTHHIDLLQNYCDGVLLIADQKMNYLDERNDFQSIIQKTFDLKKEA